MPFLEDLMPGLSGAPNLHPIFVHFPIALWTAALFFQAVAGFTGSSGARRTARWLLYLGTVGGLVAVATGLRAADQLGHASEGHELVHVHRNFMVAATVLAVLICLLARRWAREQTRRRSWLLGLALLLLTAVTTLGADRGAALVFLHGVGVAGPTQPGADHEDAH